VKEKKKSETHFLPCSPFSFFFQDTHATMLHAGHAIEGTQDSESTVNAVCNLPVNNSAIVAIKQVFAEAHAWHTHVASRGYSMGEIGLEFAAQFNHMHGTGPAIDIARPLNTLPYPTRREQSGETRALVSQHMPLVQRDFALTRSEPAAMTQVMMEMMGPTRASAMQRCLDKAAVSYKLTIARQAPALLRLQQARKRSRRESQEPSLSVAPSTEMPSAKRSCV
jgi:hypothetical protein